MTDQEVRFVFTETITISAGIDGPRLTVHTDVIARPSSPFLKAALSNDWKEAREKNIVLQEFDTSVLEGYVHWMYTGSMRPKLKAVGDTYMELFELYLLGDFLKDMVFCQKLIQHVILVRCLGVVPLQPEVCFLWERTLPTCPLRRLVRELWLAKPVDDSIALLGKDPDSPYPMEFVLDMFQELSKHAKNPKLSSHSFKTPVEILALSKTYFEDSAPKEKK
jgi:hypothetical protein